MPLKRAFDCRCDDLRPATVDPAATQVPAPVAPAPLAAAQAAEQQAPAASALLVGSAWVTRVGEAFAGGALLLKEAAKARKHEGDALCKVMKEGPICNIDEHLLTWQVAAQSQAHHLHLLEPAKGACHPPHHRKEGKLQMIWE